MCVSTSAAVYYTTVYWQKFSFEKIVIRVPSSSNKHGHSIRLLDIQKGTSHHHHHMVNKPLFHRLLTILRIGEKKYWTLKRKRRKKKKHHREICRCVCWEVAGAAARYSLLYNQPRWLDFSLVCAGAHVSLYSVCGSIDKNHTVRVRWGYTERKNKSRRVSCPPEGQTTLLLSQVCCVCSLKSVENLSLFPFERTNEEETIFPIS